MNRVADRALRLVLLACAACGPAPGPSWIVGDEIEMNPVAVTSRAGKARDVVIDDVRVRAVRASPRRRPRAICNNRKAPPKPTDRCLLSTRPDADTLVLRMPGPGKQGGVKPTPQTVLLGEGGSPRIRVPRETIRRITAWEVLDPEEFDMTSGLFEVQAGQALRLATGIEPPMAALDSAPIEFSAWLEGPGEPVQIFSEKRDPTRRPEDRGWSDHVVPLDDAHAGLMVRLRLRVRPVDPLDSRPQMPVWGIPRHLRAAGDLPPPSVVLISLDTLRAKSLSTWGYEVETSPKLTQLAREGTRFAHASSTFINTIGGHESMLTGRYHQGSFVLDRDFPMLAERLGAAGLEAAAVTENVALAAGSGFRRGFLRYEENKEGWSTSAARTFDRALQWLDGHRDRPVFLFVHTYAVHSPYQPASPYDRMFEKELADAPTDQRLYEQEIRQLDDDLAAFVAQLRERIPPERLVLVITADHGEEFGEHGGTFHLQPFDEVLGIPLLMIWPGRIPARNVVDTPVSLIDIVPTLLDLLGLGTAAGVDGRSLVPLLGKAPPSPAWKERMLFAAGMDASNKALLSTARRDHTKCVVPRTDREGRCFDLRKDPGEQHPISPASRPDLGALAGAAKRFRRGELANAETINPGRMPGQDPDQRERLRALGYIE